jgi:ABC-type polysaccharide/polyol phosphate transport system ATPase subunit
MNDIAIRARDVGIKFLIRHLRSPTVHSGIVRFLKRGPRAEDFWALRNVSFDVPVGMTFGIIGANGSGKSTLLRALARILAPDEGEIEVRGRVSSLITLGAGFEPNLSGIENIYFNGMLLGLSRGELGRKLDEIVAFAELPGAFIDAPVRTYSSGMRARLGFSVAVHVEPEILVVDEVLTVGDAKFRAKCKAKFEELFARGATIVMVQHNLETIVELCQDCMWLDHGKIVGRGSPPGVVRSYLEHQGVPVPEALAATLPGRGAESPERRSPSRSRAARA